MVAFLTKGGDSSRAVAFEGGVALLVCRYGPSGAGNGHTKKKKKTQDGTI